ncbi:TRAP transporter permease [Brevibacillus humidisoli]|uniref:TRAP transporter permease n=1 Tax=Brevibacillus humidisoli TaxID=2895522 RepID=UPI001E49BFB8|nr:TRAP transporter permease [Brevibacillus humidisoli]UFJ40725.1 TRAP transporter permease [Brevibacillus humidisoli]
MASDTKDVQQDILAKYDPESAYRTQLGRLAWVVTVIGISLTLFHIYTALRGPYVSLIQGTIHLGTALGLIFLLYPAKKSFLHKKGVPYYDILLAAAAMFANYYIVWHYERLTTKSIVLGFTTMDIIVATIGILLLLEATRRSVGLPIVVIAVLAMAYGLWGKGIPLFGHAGFDWSRLSTELFYGTDAIFGIPIQISSTYIFLFLFFGVMLTKSGIGQYFNDLAFRATGRFTGGTAKAAVTASALQGMISGSSVANTVGSGSFTIPMMKRSGFKPEFAAAAEASASTGGQIMPPIMGAAAFIMAEYTGVPYSEIMMIALIPALLYFAGVYMGIHFEARKHGIIGLPKEQLPPLRGLIKRLDLLLPLVVIVSLLLLGYTPTYAALWGIGSAYLVSFFHKETRMSLRELLKALEEGARTALAVIAACATAGIIVGIVVLTGLGGKIAGGILELAGGNFFLILFFTMIACIVLGMGLPTTANYVVTSTMAAPAMMEFGVPMIAAHMFVFYFGIVADITPPVCLAAYAGAGLAKANPMKAGMNAVKLAIAAFIIPYVFVYNPVLVLEGATVTTLLPPLLTAIVGMIGISGAIMGYFVGRTSIPQRLLLIVGGLLLVYPYHIEISLAGLVILCLVGMYQYRVGTGSRQQTGKGETGVDV